MTEKEAIKQKSRREKKESSKLEAIAATDTYSRRCSNKLFIYYIHLAMTVDLIWPAENLSNKIDKERVSKWYFEWLWRSLA